MIFIVYCKFVYKEIGIPKRKTIEDDCHVISVLKFVKISIIVNCHKFISTATVNQSVYREHGEHFPAVAGWDFDPIRVENCSIA